jgi:hypothetical protein
MARRRTPVQSAAEGTGIRPSGRRPGVHARPEWSPLWDDLARAVAEANRRAAAERAAGADHPCDSVRQ